MKTSSGLLAERGNERLRHAGEFGLLVITNLKMLLNRMKPNFVRITMTYILLMVFIQERQSKRAGASQKCTGSLYSCLVKYISLRGIRKVYPDETVSKTKTLNSSIYSREAFSQFGRSHHGLFQEQTPPEALLNRVLELLQVNLLSQ